MMDNDYLMTMLSNRPSLVCPLLLVGGTFVIKIKCWVIII